MSKTSGCLLFLSLGVMPLLAARGGGGSRGFGYRYLCREAGDGAFCQAGSWLLCSGAPERWALWGATDGDLSAAEPQGTWRGCLKQDLFLCLGICLEKSCLGVQGAVTLVLGTFMRV